jgi:hypothetical protein
MRILFFQESPCIRNWKMANALTTKGHEVDLMYVVRRPSDMYNGLNEGIYGKMIKMDSLIHLFDLLERPPYDLIHFHNEPDIWSIAGLLAKCPIIHDTHDLISTRQKPSLDLLILEGVANRGQGEGYM